MNSLSTGRDSSDAPSTNSGIQSPPAPASADALDRVSANANSSASSHDAQNPLWVIAGAMALFFAVAAAFLAAG
jgi:hypothetical protein